MKVMLEIEEFETLKALAKAISENLAEAAGPKGADAQQPGTTAPKGLKNVWYVAERTPSATAQQIVMMLENHDPTERMEIVKSIYAYYCE